MNRCRPRSARLLTAVTVVALGTLGLLPATAQAAPASPAAPTASTTSAASASSAGGSAKGGPADCPGPWLGTTRNAASTISGDGRFVVFEGYPFFEQENRDVVLRDVRRGTSTAVTHVTEFESAYYPVISDNGNRVAYFLSTEAGNRLRVYDRATGTSSDQGPVDLGAPADLSADGRFVVFGAADRAGGIQVYVRDVDARTTTLVSATPAGRSGNGYTSQPTISADGRRVLFISQSSDLTTDGSGANGGIYLRDLRTRTTTVIPNASGDTSGQAGAWPRLSPDGGSVLYLNEGLWVYDRARGTTVRASRPAVFDEYSISAIADISAGGRKVALSVSYLIGQEPTGNAYTPVLIRDVRSGADTVASAGVDGNLDPWTGSYLGAITPNGRYVTFYSNATNLPGDPDGTLDVFVRDLQAGVTTLVSDADAGPRCE